MPQPDSIPFTKEEKEDQLSKLEEHTNKILKLAQRYGLTLNAMHGSVAYDKRYLSKRDARSLCEATLQDSRKPLSSMIRKQYLVIQACRIRKEMRKRK
jgi:hypothetical protein